MLRPKNMALYMSSQNEWRSLWWFKKKSLWSVISIIMITMTIKMTIMMTIMVTIIMTIIMKIMELRGRWYPESQQIITHLCTVGYSCSEWKEKRWTLNSINEEPRSDLLKGFPSRSNHFFCIAALSDPTASRDLWIDLNYLTRMTS